MRVGPGLMLWSRPCLSPCPDCTVVFMKEGLGLCSAACDPGGWALLMPPSGAQLGPVTTCEDVLKRFLHIGGIRAEVSMKDKLFFLEERIWPGESAARGGVGGTPAS